MGYFKTVGRLEFWASFMDAKMGREVKEITPRIKTETQVFIHEL